MIRHDPKTWARKHHYAFFRSQSHPYLGLTARVPIHSLLSARDEVHKKPFGLFLYCLTEAANQVVQLRQRIRIEDGVESVVEHPTVCPAYAVEARGELFNFATVDFPQALEAFCRSTKQASLAFKDNPVLAPFDGIRDDVIYATCLPWLDFSHISHPVDTAKVDSVPRFAWGRFGDDDTVSVNVQAHHALVDGRHIGQFFQALEDSIQALSSDS